MPKTTGVERLPIGTRQARPSPAGSLADGGVHLLGRPVSAERPSRFGPPRHSGQLSADGVAVRTARISAVAPPEHGEPVPGRDGRAGDRDAHRKLTDKMGTSGR